MSSPRHPDTFDLDAIDLEGFARGVKALRGEIDASLGPDDLRHLRRIERWGPSRGFRGHSTTRIFIAIWPCRWVSQPRKREFVRAKRV